jgi:methionyl-tRNA synthetase
LVCVAWPYANSDLHVGQIAGAYLPADIYARYNRMIGNNTLMVSGSDAHGTPVTVRAEQENITPEDVFQRYHLSFLKTFDEIGIVFDNFTSTNTDNHKEVVQDVFTKLLNKKLLYLKDQELLYDTQKKRFLPDRYVEGTCPKKGCGYENARGDQCDKCGSTLDALELINPRSKLSNTTPVSKTSAHFFLKLSDFNEALTTWISEKNYWRPAVKNFSIGQLKEGLKDRAVTRDINWGIDIPLDGYENKKIYVWFEAVLGYLSASIEYTKNINNKINWEIFWKDPKSKTIYFQGKDNVPFHALILPAILIGYEGLNLPYNIPANQYVMMGGDKASSSRNTTVWMPDYLEKLPADSLRYYLTCIMPETSDSEFDWNNFVSRNNDELSAKWGNLVQRVISFAKKNMNNTIPDSSHTNSESIQLKEFIQKSFKKSAISIEKVELRNALSIIIATAQETNRYLDKKEPWKTIKYDQENAEESIFCALEAIYNIAIMFYPFVPFSSKKVLSALGNDTEYYKIDWSYQNIQKKLIIGDIDILFEKFDIETIIEKFQD